MSLNKFTDTLKGLEIDLKIGCDELQTRIFKIGEDTTQYELPLERGDEGQYLEQSSTSEVVWKNFSSYGSMYITDNSTPTPISGANDYFEIEGVSTSGNMNFFVKDGNSLQYIGTTNEVFLVIASLSWLHAGGNNDLSAVAFFKNGIIQPFTEIRCKLDDNNIYPRTTSIQALIPLSSGDIVSTRIANLEDTTDIIVNDLNFTVNKV